MGDSYKVILLGNMGVGKTSLILSFLGTPFSEQPSEVIDFRTLSRTVDGTTVNLTFTDTAGQEEFRSLTSSYYRNADVQLVVYDITDEKSFEEVNDHLAEGARYANRSHKFLVGNKVDLASTDRKITPEQGKEFAAKHGMEFFETSAKTKEEINSLLDAMARKVGGVETGGDNNVVVIKEPTKIPKKKGVCSLL